MANLTLTDPSPEQLVGMADGLIDAGFGSMASDMYRIALKRAPPEWRDRILVRLGLADQRTARTQQTFGVLASVEQIAPGSMFVSDGLATWMKAAPFLEDRRFMDLALRHADLLPIPNWHWNLQTALWAVQRSKSVAGDLVELGVFKGHTTLFCADYVEFAAWPKRWWLYDTFTGIPEDQLDEGFRLSNSQAYNPETFSYEEVRDRFAGFPNIEVIQGRVPEILLDRAPEQIAFLHVDLNNAAAEIAALDLLFDRVSPDGVILFDDFCWSNASKQRHAETAWFAARGEQILPLPTGQGLYVKR
ncbi:MAG TPA: TylF/MycF/NovP-related O-methyltransferase [Phenylobacterium sp.]|nr:TylF/MycF/NovP-related O-methyltransferase [Phenylobacterium sp.]